MAELSIHELSVTDAPSLSRLFEAQRPEYLSHFHPFEFDESTITRILAAARRDRFWGLFDAGGLSGFCMLRGFDSGYERPSYGVFVAEAASGQGLGRAALLHTLAWCAANSVERVLLKVASGNSRARGIYMAEGFEFIGICHSTGHEMLEKNVQPLE